MDLTARLAEHASFPDVPPADEPVHPSPEIATALAQLGLDLAREVPSCVSVSILLPHLAGNVVVTSVLAGTAVVLASLAVPLLAAGGGATLVLQAAHAGAFVLLAEELAGRLGTPGAGLMMDAHLSLPRDATGETLAASLAALRVVEQAVGALIEKGWLPEDARRELARLATSAGLTTAAAAGRVLESGQDETDRLG